MPLWMCIITGALALALDWSAIGPNRLRDRFASLLYIPSFMGWFASVGLARWVAKNLAAAPIEGRVVSVIVGFVIIGWWVCAMLPAWRPFARLGQVEFPSAKTGGAAGGATTTTKTPSGTAVATRSKASPMAHINVPLLMLSAGVAIAMQLVMPGSSYEAFVAWLASLATTTAVAVGTAVGGWLGFH